MQLTERLTPLAYSLTVTCAVGVLAWLAAEITGGHYASYLLAMVALTVWAIRFQHVRGQLTVHDAARLGYSVSIIDPKAEGQ